MTDWENLKPTLEVEVGQDRAEAGPVESLQIG